MMTSNKPVSQRRALKLGAVSAFALSLAAFGAVAAGPARAAPPPPAPPLVTPAWLKAHLNDPGLVILEVYDNDSQHTAFEAGHVPGAVFTGFLDDNWRETVGGVVGMLPPAEHIAKVIGHFGIGDTTRVILVTGGRTSGDFDAATRTYWTLSIEGQRNVSILNGGDHAWFADPTDPVATGVATPKEVTFVPHRARGYLATMSMVAKTLSTHAYQLVDARPPEQYDGKVTPATNSRPGTLPGAHSLPTTVLLTPDNEGVLPMDQLTPQLKRGGVVAGVPTITFCNTGHLASADWFVLREVFNNPKVRLYDGSMTEWSKDPSRPMVMGTSPF